MSRQAIEVQVLGIVDRVLQGRRVEDDLVECKRLWPKAKRVARQLAGHANLARGDRILWIIGLDENEHKVYSADEHELSDWWAAIEGCFDERIAPSLEHLSVPVSSGESVVALRFD